MFYGAFGECIIIESKRSEEEMMNERSTISTLAGDDALMGDTRSHPEHDG